MKSLILGGAGFIGSHLCDALLAKGELVVCVDNFYIGTKENIAHLRDHPAFKFYEVDANELESLRKVFEREKPDYVFHLAANSDIQASALEPLVEYKNTYSTTFNVLECMRRTGAKKLFFSSTSAVYGEVEGNASEEDARLTPISYYGGAKLGSEAMISAFAYMNDMEALVFRFPNVIGPRLTHGVIFDFINRLRAEPSHLRILGDGNQTKPYLHVHDLVEAIIRFMNVPKGVTLYNVGVDTATSVTRIAEIVTQKMGLAGIPFEYTGGRGGWKGDVPQFQYNLLKIHLAGWKASMTSDEAVMRTVEQVLSCKL
ncbi:NAD-dependent epimerase/dehydratase family protein [Aminipila luticellarii]|uniref:NAD-dependent epimerase/dehydratase family protein n=1 Tax=Aminipila luticellarii TaxID=2507160 RepID=A0A410PSM0_9FIRM|nr:NAD-dependent epimerase/dehydratase family protein [Aminipila luticellarii]QAT41913.1 NAD-dependent epimerase/dehydratase family protein [Aminipila luticellarii]